MVSLHRIYQGRMLHCSLLSKPGEGFDQLPWQHFRLFQQAINYYLLALAALENRSEGPMADLRKQMEEVWEPWTDRRGQCRPGLKSLLAEPLVALKGAPVVLLNEAFDLLQPEAGVPDSARGAALDLLLSKCQGENGIQQASKSYWPRFCWTDCRATYDVGANVQAAKQGFTRLQQVIHSDGVQSELEALAADMTLEWANIKIEPGKFKEGDQGKTRLLEAVEHLAQGTGPRQKALLGENPEEWLRVQQRIQGLSPEGIKISVNRRAAKDLTSAAVLFQAAPCRLTQRLLACSIKAPGKSPKSVKKQAASAVVAHLAETLGDDPIKLCRGRRGFAFPAFTALPIWEGAIPGGYTWKDFDMAAFAGALLTLNQINQKTQERRERREALEKVVAYMEGRDSDLSGTPFASDEAGELPPVLGKDPRYPLLLELLSTDLAVCNEATDDEEVAYTLRTRTLRGFAELRERWEPVIAHRAPGCSDEDLKAKLLEALHAHQVAEPYTMGSAPLLTSLCEPKYWPLWVPVDGETPRLIEGHADLLEHRSDIERLRGPIRFTPADPVHSPRSYDFTANTGREKTVFLPEWGRVEVSLAVQAGGKARPQRALLIFSAPRAQRDGLDDLAKAAGLPWAPPVLAAFEDLPKAQIAKVPMGLMPHPTSYRTRAKRMDPSAKQAGAMVLNFPVTLEVGDLQASLSAQGRWKKAFNTAPPPDKRFLHLLWPSTSKGDLGSAAWWQSPDPFGILSVDLGPRTAAAAARLRVHSGLGRKTWELGTAEGRTWWAELQGTALLRLPGEDSPIPGQRHHEKDGRSATEQEWEESKELIEKLGLQLPDFELDNRSLPRLNDLLLVAFRRAQSRLRQHLRWLWMLEEKERQSRALQEIAEQKRIPDWAAWARDTQISRLIPVISIAIQADRQLLPETLVRLAERIVPLRAHHWVWRQSPGGRVAFELVQKPGRSQGDAPLIRGQRGLSMARLEQLEELRRRCQTLNRLLQREPGSAPPRSSELRSQPMPEPCQDLLDKLEEIKRQRVAQTAHLILVEALGLRLRPSGLDPRLRLERDQHGEYEPIPGRGPVSMIVLEELKHYRTSQGQGRSENSRLMKWCHQAIADKLKQLAEPFGLPVLTVAPAYSSRFDSRSGIPGFRAIEVKLPDSQRYRWKKELERIESKVESERSLGEVVIQETFAALRDAEASRGPQQGKPPLTLLLPQSGGPVFVPASFALEGSSASLTQADINAAINLGLRAVASPEAFALLPRVAVQGAGAGLLLPKLGSKVDKARFKPGDQFVLAQEEKKVDTLFAVMLPLCERFKGDGVKCTTRQDLPLLVPGRILWGRLKHELQWAAVRRINRARVAKWQARQFESMPF